jgi:hypothetical protein
MAKTTIPNPNQRPPLSPSERELLNAPSVNTFGTIAPEPAPEAKALPRKKSTGHMITVPDDIWEDLENYMAYHPEEGSKSGLITRLVASYLRKKKNE